MRWRTVAAELCKAATLPGMWVGATVALIGSAGLTLLTAIAARSALSSGRRDGAPSPFETAVAIPTMFVTVAAVAIGVVAISSEYTATRTDVGGGRQIATTLAAIPRRIDVLVSKAITVVVLVVVVATITLPASLGVANLVLSGVGVETVPAHAAWTRCIGSTIYWVLTGLIAFAITVMTRSGIVPLIVLIANNALVSFSLLLSKLTPLAHWLPDLAGRRLFGLPSTVEGGLATLPGAFVMAGWTMALLIIAGVVVSRRDA